MLLSKADITFAGMIEVFSQFFDFYGPLGYTQVAYITKAPTKKKISPNNITKPFSGTVWIITFFCLLTISGSLYLTYKTYNETSLRALKLTKQEKFPSNFLLFPFARLTEPDSLPWFRKWSSGKFLVFLWMLLSSCLMLFYHSNLRANLMTINYEETPKTLKEVAEKARKVYIHEAAIKQRYKLDIYFCTPVLIYIYLSFRKSYLAATGQKHTAKYIISDIAEKSGGIFLSY